MPIQTFALSGGKVPAAKPMHTGTLGKTSRGGVNRSISEIPRPAALGGFAGRGSSEDGLRQPEPNGGSDAVKKAFIEAAVPPRSGVFLAWRGCRRSRKVNYGPAPEALAKCSRAIMERRKIRPPAIASRRIRRPGGFAWRYF